MILTTSGRPNFAKKKHVAVYVKKNFTIKDSLSRSGNVCIRSESSLITWLARGSFQVNSEIDTAFTPENKCW